MAPPTSKFDPKDAETQTTLLGQGPRLWSGRGRGSNAKFRYKNSRIRLRLGLFWASLAALVVLIVLLALCSSFWYG